MLSNYHLMISDFYSIPIGNVKTLVLTFLIKNMFHYEHLQLYLTLGLKDVVYGKNMENVRNRNE